MTIAVVPIVEGHGEVAAVPHLVRRVAGELFSRWDVRVLPAIRSPRSRLLRAGSDGAPGELEKAVRLAELKLAGLSEPGFILLLLDADDDCPALLASRTLPRVGAQVSVVFAKIEFETWFVASAESLAELIDVDLISEDPESEGLRKRWIQVRFRAGRYSESVDQVRLVARMDLSLTRRRCPSFDKLCREIDQRLQQHSSEG